MTLHEALQAMLVLAATLEGDCAANEIADAGNMPDFDAAKWRAAKAKVMAHWQEMPGAPSCG
jgi:hypothetical protein